ncbi:hypothetical protein [Bradyrhizobium sp. CB3481]|uniref:hypothetical protein n=1 Tax=Bradyrhizobium sp. CB3481 TaxID=3039158 RepID=UPI0024B1D4DF|nr:hypothetical protein [Bradyrhizobium sp. CB3481]WFU18235.1 hypothetical protein QA643_07800 [Bradyrhizobium sp. CB3481]
MTSAGIAGGAIRRPDQCPVIFIAELTAMESPAAAGKIFRRASLFDKKDVSLINHFPLA